MHSLQLRAVLKRHRELEEMERVERVVERLKRVKGVKRMERVRGIERRWRELSGSWSQPEEQTGEHLL